MVSVLQQPIKQASFVKDSTELGDKACKMVSSGVKIAKEAIKLSGGSGVWKPVSELTAQTGIFSGVVAGTNIIKRAYEFVCPDKVTKGKKDELDHRWKCWKKCSGEVSGDPTDAEFKKQKNVFKDDGYWDVTKTISQIFLTMAHSVAFVQFLEVLGMVAFGAASSTLGLIKNIIYIPASTFGIISGGISLSESKHHVNNVARKVANCKNKRDVLEPENAKQDVDPKLNADEKWTKDTLIKHYTDKRAETTEAGKIAKYNQFIKDINSSNNSDELKNTKFGKYFVQKVEGWENNEKIAKSNKGKAQTKTWLGIANNVGKFVFGILGIVGLVLGIATNPWFAIAISTGWFATYTMGLTKGLYAANNGITPIKAPVVKMDFAKA